MANSNFPEWIDVNQEKPKSGKRVIFTWENSHGKRRTGMGYYADEFALQAEDTWENFYEMDDDFFEYRDDDVNFEVPYLPEGFYEELAEREYCIPQYRVTHWMKLPIDPPGSKQISN
jgi:hypothetical protein